MPKIKTCAEHPASMAERVAKRLRNSGQDAHADVVVQKGEGPLRTFTNIHNSGGHQPLPYRKEENDA